MSNQLPYTPKQFPINGAQRHLRSHTRDALQALRGLRKETNNLREQIARFLADGKVDQEPRHADEQAGADRCVGVRRGDLLFLFKRLQRKSSTKTEL
ncbi:MAG: hypothetical protein ACREBC_26235 [Pyrinomonadaceae bacterium]